MGKTITATLADAIIITSSATTGSTPSSENGTLGQSSIVTYFMHALFGILVSFLPADFQVRAIMFVFVVAVAIVIILVAVLVQVLVLLKKTFTSKCDSFVAGTVESLSCV